jgi:hypothetical protein
MVYVDDMEAPFGRMIMCHMIADTRRELDEMATKIGVAHKWRQKSDTESEHYDVCKSARAKAIMFGAKEIEWIDTAKHIKLRRVDPDWLSEYMETNGEKNTTQSS